MPGSNGRFDVDGCGFGWRSTATLPIIVLAILSVAVVAGHGAVAVFDWGFDAQVPKSRAPGELEALSTARLAIFLLVFQAIVAALTVVAARVIGWPGIHLLPLKLPASADHVAVFSMFAVLVAAALYASAIFAYDRAAIVNDVRPFAEELRTRAGWLMLIAAAFGAPIAEELLFRGLLFGVLRRSPLGLLGASLLSAGLWAGLHLGYSYYGVSGVVLIGLYLAWLREKTDSLVLPMLCHGLYNGLIVLALTVAPDGALQGG